MTGGTGAVWWLILAVILFVIESMTVQMICVWFAAGALLAMIASLLGAPLWLQMLVFLVTSVAVLIPGRRLVMERLQNRRVATNADQVIGCVGVVQTEIDNLKQTGRVLANGLDWTARAVWDGLVIPAGAEVRVLYIDGVKLIVEPLTEADATHSQETKE